MSYLILKYVHILSMVLLFGTGLGSAFYKWMADRSGNITHISVTNRHVVLADWLFTTPTVLIQPITGFWMVYLTQLPLSTPWVAISFGLYVLAGLCWVPVVFLQIKMRKLSDHALQTDSELTEEYWKVARQWFWLGVPTFIAMVLVVLLMVFKFGLGFK